MFIVKLHIPYMNIIIAHIIIIIMLKIILGVMVAYILVSEIDLNSDVGRHIQCYTILYSYLKDMHTDNIL